MSAPVMYHEHMSFESLRRQFFWYDHFWGDSIQDLWSVTGTGDYALLDGVANGAIETECDAGETLNLSWGGYRSLLVTHELAVEFRFKKSSVDNNCVVYLWLGSADNSNRILAYDFTPEHTIFTINHGTITSTGDQGDVSADTWIRYRFQCHNYGGVHCHYYLDGQETSGSPLSTNLPVDVWLTPKFYTYENPAGSTQTFLLDYVGVRM